MTVFKDTSASGVAARALQMRRDHEKTVERFERELHTKLDRITNSQRQLQDSMVAYSCHMRTFNNKRFYVHHDPSSCSDDGGRSLRVQAKHIPKRRQLSKLPSFDRPTADTSNQGHAQSEPSRSRRNPAVKLAPIVTKSVPLPDAPPVERQRFIVNFASASDLQELDRRGPILGKSGASVKPVIQGSRKPHSRSSRPLSKPQRPEEPPFPNLTHAGLTLHEQAPADSHNKLSAKQKLGLLKAHSDGCVSVGVSSTETEDIDTASIKAIPGDDLEVVRKREDVTKRLLKNAIETLQKYEKRPDQMVSVMKIKRGKGFRLRNPLESIPEGENELMNEEHDDSDSFSSGSQASSRGSGRGPVRRERHRLTSIRLPKSPVVSRPGLADIPENELQGPSAKCHDCQKILPNQNLNYSEGEQVSEICSQDNKVGLKVTVHKTQDNVEPVVSTRKSSSRVYETHSIESKQIKHFRKKVKQRAKRITFLKSS